MGQLGRAWRAPKATIGAHTCAKRSRRRGLVGMKLVGVRFVHGRIGHAILDDDACFHICMRMGAVVVVMLLAARPLQACQLCQVVRGLASSISCMRVAKLAFNTCNTTLKSTKGPWSAAA